MLTSLSRKLAAVLLLLFCLVGGIFAAALIVTTRLHNQEAAQRFNLSLADHLASGKKLLSDGAVDGDSVAEMFHMLMVVNPSIELYLLDVEGAILSFSAPPGKVRRRRVDIAPIRLLLSGEGSFPIFGDDPRDPAGKKIFSVSEIGGDTGAEGYLYVILGGEEYESALQLFRGSYILRLGLLAAGGGLLFTLVAGILFFHQLTKRLRVMADEMEFFRQSGFSTDPAPRDGDGRVDGAASGDEIDRLKVAYDAMSLRIGEQIEALKEADSMRREIVTNVSHDLRTPLASLKGYLETLVMKGDSLAAEEREDYLETALQNTAELERRVEELFELAGLDSPDLRIAREDFPLGELADAVVQKFQVRAAEKGISLESKYPEGLPLVNGDMDLVGRVLENLFENALRCTGRGGAITLTLTLAPRPDGVGVSLTDTGSGISRDDLPHIFDRYFTSKGRGEKAAGKAGLGLAIAQKIIEHHGSTIEVKSDPGKGATFFFLLPSQ